MAAPSPTVRVQPSGQFLTDGWQSLVTFGHDPNLAIWEIEVTPSGRDNGEPKVITNQWSGPKSQKAPQHSTNSTDMKLTFHYDPSEIPAIHATVGRRDTITTTYPTGATFAEFGYVRSVSFGALKKGGDPPTGEMTITITDTDPSTCEIQDGVFADGTGTQSVC